MTFRRLAWSVTGLAVAAAMAIGGSLIGVETATADESGQRNGGEIETMAQSNEKGRETSRPGNKSARSRSESSASASASASSGAATKGDGNCTARSSASARATANGESEYDHQEDYAEKRGDGCSANAGASATVRSGGRAGSQ